MGISGILEVDGSKVIPLSAFEFAAEVLLSSRFTEIADLPSVEPELEAVIDIDRESIAVRLRDLEAAFPLDLEIVGRDARRGIPIDPSKLDCGIVADMGGGICIVRGVIRAGQSLPDGAAFPPGKPDADLPTWIEIQLVGRRVGEVIDEFVEEGEKSLAGHEIAGRKVERDTGEDDLTLPVFPGREKDVAIVEPAAYRGLLLEFLGDFLLSVAGEEGGGKIAFRRIGDFCESGMRQGLGGRRKSLGSRCDLGLIGESGGKKGGVLLVHPFIVEVGLDLVPCRDKETSTIPGKVDQRFCCGGGESGDVAEDDDIEHAEVGNRPDRGGIDDLGLDEKPDRVERRVILHVEVVGSRIADSRRIRIEGGVQGQGGRGEGDCGKGGRAVEGTSRGAAIDDEDLELIGHGRRIVSCVVRIDVVGDFERGRDGVGSGLGKLMCELYGLLFARLQLAQRLVAVITTVVHGEKERFRGHRFVPGVFHRDLDLDGTIDPDDIPGEGHVGNGDVSQVSRKRKLAQHDLWL